MELTMRKKKSITETVNTAVSILKDTCKNYNKKECLSLTESIFVAKVYNLVKEDKILRALKYIEAKGYKYQHSVLVHLEENKKTYLLSIYAKDGIAIGKCKFTV